MSGLHLAAATASAAAAVAAILVYRLLPHATAAPAPEAARAPQPTDELVSG